MRNDRIKILNLAFFCWLVYACSSDNDRRSLSGTSAIDLQQIKARGTLIAATDYNSINYYILNGRPLGFQYELLERFAASIGVRLTIQSYPDLIETFKKLNNRSCDIIAMNLTELP